MQHQRRENRIAQHLPQLTDGQKGTMPQDESAQPTNEDEPVETIHVYFVKEEDEQPMVDSSLHEATERATQPLASQSHPRQRLLAPLLVVAGNLLLALAVFVVHIYPILTATATITIVPKQAVVTAQLTLAPMHSRIFHPVSRTQSRTVPATGKGHHHAVQATGTITLYNASLQEQTIGAGTLFIGSDGVHIVTDQPVTIPGATPPVEGHVSVSAHALNAGAAGNMQAGDIHGACCRENIFADNSAFSGGADERSFRLVTRQDIASIIASVLPQLTGRIRTVFQEQLRPGEILTPTLCSHTIVTDSNAGDEATAVSGTVTASCVAGAYTGTDLHAKVQQALAQQAEQKIGKGYLLASYSQTSPMETRIQQGRLVIAATFQGRMVYHYSAHDLTILRQQLAGKSSQQGIAILSYLSGAAHISVQMEKNGTFPTNPTHIHILFLVVS